LLSGRAGNM